MLLVKQNDDAVQLFQELQFYKGQGFKIERFVRVEAQ
jgi:hypothetical protein